MDKVEILNELLKEYNKRYVDNERVARFYDQLFILQDRFFNAFVYSHSLGHDKRMVFTEEDSALLYYILSDVLRVISQNEKGGLFE